MLVSWFNLINLGGDGKFYVSWWVGFAKCMVRRASTLSC